MIHALIEVSSGRLKYRKNKVFQVELKMHDKLKRKNAIPSEKRRITSKTRLTYKGNLRGGPQLKKCKRMSISP